MTSIKRLQSTTPRGGQLGERIVSHARKLGMQLGVGIVTDDDRKFAKLLQSPEGVLDWFGMPNFPSCTP